jgi:hypothetical protein
MSCPYQNALGIPGQGFHSYRLFNIALGDVVLLLLFAVVVQWIINQFSTCSYNLAVLISFLIGIVIHRICCVRTTIDQLLFP